MPIRSDRNIGFSLLEILAAMAILTIIVVILGVFFDQASKAWTRGEKQVITYDLARSAIDVLFRDMTVAVVDKYLPFAVDNEAAIHSNGTAVIRGGFGTSSLSIGTTDMIRFVAFTGRRSGARETSDLDDIAYWVKLDKKGRGRLYRRAFRLDLYTDKAREFSVIYPTWDSLFDVSNTDHNRFFTVPGDDDYSDVILDNLYSFEVFCYTNEPPEILDYDSMTFTNQPPPRIDFFVVTLTDAQWARMDTFSDLSDWHRYVTNNMDEFKISCAFPLRNR